MMHGMNPPEILAHVRAMMVELFELEAARIVPQAQLVADLDLDSIDAIDMVVKLQDVIGRRVDEQELHGLRTVEDVVTLIHRHVNARPAS